MIPTTTLLLSGMLPGLLTLGCTPKGDDTGGGRDTGSSLGCVEVSREEVSDTSLPAGTLDFSIDSVMAGAAGDWTGDAWYGMYEEGTPVSASATFHLDGPWYAIHSEVEGSDTGTWRAVAYPICEDSYQTSLGLSLWIQDGSTSLVQVEGAAATLTLGGSYLADGNAGSFSMPLTDAQHGELTPDGVDPTEWDTISMSLDGSFDSTGWHGQVWWTAERVMGDVAEAMGTAVLTWRTDTSAG